MGIFGGYPVSFDLQALVSSNITVLECELYFGNHNLLANSYWFIFLYYLSCVYL